MVVRAPFVSSCLALDLRLPEGPGASAICRKPLSLWLPLRADKSRSNAAPKPGQLLDMPYRSAESFAVPSCCNARGNPPLQARSLCGHRSFVTAAVAQPNVSTYDDFRRQLRQ